MPDEMTNSELLDKIQQILENMEPDPECEVMLAVYRKRMTQSDREFLMEILAEYEKAMEESRNDVK